MKNSYGMSYALKTDRGAIEEGQGCLSSEHPSQEKVPFNLAIFDGFFIRKSGIALALLLFNCYNND